MELQEGPTTWGFVLAAKNIPGIIGHNISSTIGVQIFSHLNLEEIEDK